MTKRRRYLIIVTFAIIIFIMKIYIGVIDKGHTGDLLLYKSWASSFLKYGFNIYEYQPTIDYPPLYFIMLSPFVWIIEHLESLNAFGLGVVLLKLPSIIADFASAYLIYRIISRKLEKPTIAVIASLFYLIHPAILVNTSGWGQTDSILTTLLILSLMLISERKLKYAMIVSALALLLKPTAILFIPFIGLLFIMYKDVKEQIISGFFFALFTAVIVLPFKGFNLFKLYISDMNKYPRASLHAANLHTLLGGDLAIDSEKVLGLPFSYDQMGIVLMGIFILVIAYMIYKNRAILEQRIFTLGWLYSTGVFILMHNMHERYQFFVVALGLLALVENRKHLKFLPVIYLTQSFIIFFNQFLVLHFSKANMQLIRTLWIKPLSFTLEILALFNVLCFIILITLLIRNLNKGDTQCILKKC